MVPRSAPAASTQGRSFMLDRFFLLLSAFAVLAAAGGGEARAHPHVWVTMKSELIYSADGALTGVRQAWMFDDMFSTFATQGIESKVKGAFTREELAPLAEVNVSSLKEFDYFTYARVNGKKTPFGDPTDYWLDFTNGVLTLHFTLPLKAPVKAQNLELAVYDPTVFVDFTFAQKEPVKLVDAPPECKAAVVTPQSPAAQGQQLGEAFFNSLNAQSGFGAQFANKIAVKCP